MNNQAAFTGTGTIRKWSQSPRSAFLEEAVDLGAEPFIGYRAGDHEGVGEAMTVRADDEESWRAVEAERGGGQFAIGHDRRDVPLGIHAGRERFFVQL